MEKLSIGAHPGHMPELCARGGVGFLAITVFPVGLDLLCKGVLADRIGDKNGNACQSFDEFLAVSGKKYGMNKRPIQAP